MQYLKQSALQVGVMLVGVMVILLGSAGAVMTKTADVLGVACGLRPAVQEVTWSFNHNGITRVYYLGGTFTNRNMLPQAETFLESQMASLVVGLHAIESPVDADDICPLINIELPGSVTDATSAPDLIRARQADGLRVVEGVRRGFNPQVAETA